MKTLTLNDYQVILLGHAIYNYRFLLRKEPIGGALKAILAHDAIRGLNVLENQLYEEKAKEIDQAYKEKHGTN